MKKLYRFKREKIHDPLEGKFQPAPAIIREETAWLDYDKDVLSNRTGKIRKDKRRK